MRVQPVYLTARLYLPASEQGELSKGWLAYLIYRHGRCASSRVDPDQWFPVAQDAAKAREEAADAIAVCAACPVRAECLEFALRHSSGFGAHGVWGGMVEADRRSLRLRWLGGSTAGQCLRAFPAVGDTATGARATGSGAGHR